MSTDGRIREKLETIEERNNQRLLDNERKRRELLKQNKKYGSGTEKKKPGRHIRNAFVCFLCSFALFFGILYFTYLILFKDRIQTFPFAKCAVISILMSAVSVLLGLFACRKERKSIKQLFSALEMAARGDFDVRLSSDDAGYYRESFEDFNEIVSAFKAVSEDLSGTIEIAKEAGETKKKFLTNMSHEIRTPLNTMLGFNEMIIRESRENRIRSYGKDIKGAGRTLLSLINDVLDTSKLEEGKLEIIPARYDIASLINDISNMFMERARDKGLELIIRVDEKTPHLLKGDDIRIKQCILNILSNAIKYTDNGSVTLEIGFARIDERDVLLTVSVQDTGRGMKPTDIDKLFAPFEKIDDGNGRNIEGIGLGMSITRNILLLMDSELRVESKYGMGSTFKFSVAQTVLDWEPVGNIEESYEKQRESEGRYKESFRAPDARVLVVDDSSVNLMIVEGLLKKTQMQLDMVESGKAAIEKSNEVKYDIILLDHMMPEMDGVETLKHLRNDEGSLNKDSIIIALTANVIEGARETYLDAGFTDYLGKPIEPEKLEAAVKNYLPKELLITEGWIEEEEPQDFEEDDFVDVNDINSPKEDEFITKLRSVKAINPDTGLEYSGSLELYKKVVGEFADTGRSRADMIQEYFEDDDVRNYTIQVHALKSASRIIGAAAVSRLAAALEAAGNGNDMVRIKNGTPELLKMYRELVSQLEPLMENDDNLPLIDENELKDAIASIREMADGFDFDSVDCVMEQLKNYKMPDNFKDFYKNLKNLVAEVARDDILLLIDNL